MEHIIKVAILEKIAIAPPNALYVCGNSDFVIEFDFDEEWNAHDTKTARFKFNGTYEDVVFSGAQCPVPIISGTYNIEVGVFAGNLHTTTPAYISAKKSILCGGGVPADPTPDVYAQIMEKLNEFDGVESPHIGDNGNWWIGDEDTGVRAVAHDGKDGKDGKDGVDGKDGYTPQKGVDYFDGQNGTDGEDGYTPKKGVDYFDGANGKDGKDGFSPTVEAVEIEGGHEVTITDVQGPKRFEVKDGKTPVKGTDYYTVEDKTEMVNEVIAAMPEMPAAGTLVVDMLSFGKTASHSASEIKAFLDAGGLAVLERGGTYIPVFELTNEYVRFKSTTVYDDHVEQGDYYVDESKKLSITSTIADCSGVKSVNGLLPDARGNVEITGGCSWDDLSDRPFGDARVLLEEKTILASAINEDGYFELTDVPQLSIGEIYNVIVDGVSYRCEVIDDLEMGNTVIRPVDDDENFPFEFFGQWYRYVDGKAVFTGISEFYVKAIDGESFTISIVEDGLKTIDEKYLPYKTETWTFKMADGTTVEKQVVLK